MQGLRILITNSRLINRGGSELYISDLAAALLARGHSPVVYSPNLGPMADEIRKKTIPVTNDLNTITVPPDVIHGQNNLETISALLQFPKVPAVFFVHNNLWKADVPPRIPRILRYVAVDYTCRDRLVSEHGIPENRLTILYNAVDVNLFKQRERLPDRPQRALLFSNYSNTHFEAVSEACKRTGLRLDVVGKDSGNVCANPETILGNYDIVFAKARCALEAMAVGTAVILCDFQGAGPMVTTSEFDRLRMFNFGHRTLNKPISADVLTREIDRFDPIDATSVSNRVRVEACLDSMTDSVTELYNNVIAEYATTSDLDPEAESRAVASFLRWLSIEIEGEEADFRRSPMYLLREKIDRIPIIRRLAKGAVRLISGSNSQ